MNICKTYSRCTYCGRYYQKTQGQKRCKECEMQFKDIFEKINKRNLFPVKNLELHV